MLHFLTLRKSLAEGPDPQQRIRVLEPACPAESGGTRVNARGGVNLSQIFLRASSFSLVILIKGFYDFTDGEVRAMTDIIHNILPSSATPASRIVARSEPSAQSVAGEVDAVVTKLNPAATYLSKQGMDFAKATVTGDSELHFNMQFSAKATDTVTAQGRHSQQTGEFDIAMDFAFTASQRVKGASTTTTTEGRLHIDGFIKSSRAHVPAAPSENLISLLRRVIKDLGKLASSKGTADVERILTEQQLNELTKSQSTQAEQNLTSIVEILIMIAKLKQVLREDQQPAKLAPVERGNTGEALATVASGQLTHFRLEIRDSLVSAADLHMPGKTDSASLVSEFDAVKEKSGNTPDATESDSP